MMTKELFNEAEAREITLLNAVHKNVIDRGVSMLHNLFDGKSKDTLTVGEVRSALNTFFGRGLQAQMSQSAVNRAENFILRRFAAEFNA